MSAGPDGQQAGSPEHPPDSPQKHRKSIDSTVRSQGAKGNKRPAWDENHHVHASQGVQDKSRLPYNRRRYFGDQHASLSHTPDTYSHKEVPQLECDGRPLWNSQFHIVPSVDNGAIHRHFRHYFDRRGLPSTFRSRPALLPHMYDLPPRTRPSTSERTERILNPSASAPSVLNMTCPDLQSTARSTWSNKSGGSGRWGQMSGPLDAESRSVGDIHWGTQRCQMFGPDKKVGKERYPGDPVGKPRGEKKPWVWNHHISDHEDKEFLNPSPRVWTAAGRRQVISCHARGRADNLPLVDDPEGGGRRSRGARSHNSSGILAQPGDHSRTSPSGIRLAMPGSANSWIHET